ncbi:hypothetical protein GCM10011282_06660 [Undibacterium macrobrachii]|uniref:Uncharacterized protein n=1 Tax=Undibacterium macrobrachii TaxID=1119058 RepID=A0ABQ2X7T7_9BURK|nr:hypothetical protein GCM10011282_06660 [Undibacterium macrobrachii]
MDKQIALNAGLDRLFSELLILRKKFALTCPLPLIYIRMILVYSFASRKSLRVQVYELSKYQVGNA